MPRKPRVPKRVGRPSKYQDDLTLDSICYYIDNFHKKPFNEQFPSIAGLCTYLHIGKDTLLTWLKDSNKEELNQLIQCLLAKQEVLLINSGITGEFNSAITKLLLTKHGYSDKVEAIGFEGSSNNVQPIQITFVNPSANVLINKGLQSTDTVQLEKDITPSIGMG